MFGDDDNTMRAIYLGLLLAFLLATFGWRRVGIGGALRSLMIWALLVLALVTGYAYRAPIVAFFEPVLRELDPSRAVAIVGPAGEEELVIRRGPDGHFHVDGAVGGPGGGATIGFLVDTGATSTVLSLDDAEAAGIDVGGLRFDRMVRTANGNAFYARAELPSLEIGPYRLVDVPVGVMPRGTLSTSLLGLNVLDRFASYRIEGDRMVLTP